jgi:hypothetical protein
LLKLFVHRHFVINVVEVVNVNVKMHSAHKMIMCSNIQQFFCLFVTAVSCGQKAQVWRVSAQLRVQEHAASAH